MGKSGGLRHRGVSRFWEWASQAHTRLSLGYLFAIPTARAPVTATPQASIFTAPLELAAVWGIAVTVGSGTAGAWAWWTGADVGSSLEDGFVAGFLYGIPVTICAAIAMIILE
jgi:hypothetical protein